MVRTHGLRKRYGCREVLRGLDLCVPQGSLFGFLGPNGAGKTTTLRILLGLLRASAGEARVLGHEAWRDGTAIRAEIGYLPGDIRHYDHLTGRQTLEFLAAARRHDCAAEIRRLAERFDLDLDRLVRAYSRGMRQKLGLIGALMHRPALLVLDEPTIALDPLVRQTLFVELRQAVSEARTVLFSSHTLAEVDALCDRVAVLRDGEIVEQERIEVLRRKALRRVEIVFDNVAEPPLPAGLREGPRRDGRRTYTWTGEMPDLLAWLARAGVRDATIAPPDLEDLFLAYYSDGTSRGGQR